jgi:hypothetical protein
MKSFIALLPAVTLLAPITADAAVNPQRSWPAVAPVVAYVAPIPIDHTAVQGNAMVSGIVVAGWSAVKGRGIPGALVQAVSDTSVQTTETDSNGRFYFLALLPGDYQFLASAANYINGCYWRGLGTRSTS